MLYNQYISIERKRITKKTNRSNFEIDDLRVKLDEWLFDWYLRCRDRLDWFLHHHRIMSNDRPLM